ncbi:MAG: hypothetical protein K2K35_09070 [Lachnospiraceae bacterium]|nr:hypothetical protein [Lachnospiraceae bacterium]
MGIESPGLDKGAVFYGYNNTCGEFSDISNSLVLEYINDVKTYVEDKGFQYRSLGTAPGAVKGLKAEKKGNYIYTRCQEAFGRNCIKKHKRW